MGIEFNRVNPADFQAEVNKSSAAPQAEATEQTFNFEASEADRNMGLGVQSNGGPKVVVHPSGRYQITKDGKTRYYAKDGTELNQKFFESQCGKYLENGVWLKTETKTNIFGQKKQVQYYDIDYTNHDPSKHMLYNGDIKKRTLKTDKSIMERAWDSVKQTLYKADEAISRATGGHIQRGASGTAELAAETAVGTAALAGGSAAVTAKATVVASNATPAVIVGATIMATATACNSLHEDATGKAGGCDYNVKDNGDGTFTAYYTSGPAEGYKYTFKGDETDALNFTDNSYGQVNNMLKAMGFKLDDNNVTLKVAVNKASWNIAGQESVPDQGFSLKFPTQDLANFGHNVPLQAQCSILGQTFNGKAEVITDSSGKQFVKIDSEPNPIYIRQENREIDGNLWENATVVYVGGTSESKATYVIGDGGGQDIAIGKLNKNANEGTTFYYYGEQQKTDVSKDVYQVAYARAQTHVGLSGGI